MRALVLSTALLLGSGAAAQSISFDRPESWALKYFAAVTTFTPLQMPEVRGPGSFEIGLELGWVPHLSESQRTVGFNGTALEDLNKTPIVGRVRTSLGLPGGIALELGWIPPVEMDGAKPNLLSGALERPFWEGSGGAIGLRVFGQIGYVEGDFTCWEDVVGQPAGSSGNPLGCATTSEDVARLDEVGAALTGGWRFSRSGALHAAVGATYNDLRFQVGAYYVNGTADNTLLTTHGWTGWGAAGIGWCLGGPGWIGVEAFYSPLSVVRPPGTTSENDGLFNVRGLLRFRFR